MPDLTHSTTDQIVAELGRRHLAVVLSILQAPRSPDVASETAHRSRGPHVACLGLATEAAALMEAQSIADHSDVPLEEDLPDG